MGPKILSYFCCSNPILSCVKLFDDQLVSFRVSDEIVKYLIDTYHEYNFSMNALCHTLAYCLYDHLGVNYLNALLVADATTSKHTRDTLHEHACVRVDMLAYLRMRNNNTNSSSSSSSSNDEDQVNAIVDRMAHMQRQWFQQNAQFMLVSQLLFELVRHFPNEPSNANDDMMSSSLGSEHDSSLFSVSRQQTFVEFYARATHHCLTSGGTSSSIVDSPHFVNLRKLVKLSSTHTIGAIARALLDLAASACASNERLACLDEAFVADLNSLVELLGHMVKAASAGGGGGQRHTNLLGDVDDNDDENDDEDNVVLKDLKVNTLVDTPTPAVAATGAKLARRYSVKPTAAAASSSATTPSATRTSALATAAASRGLNRRNSMMAATTTTKMATTSNANIDALKSKLIEWLSGQLAKYFSAGFLASKCEQKYFCYANLDRVRTRLYQSQRMAKHATLVNPYKSVFEVSEQMRLHLGSSSSSSTNISPQKRLKKTHQATMMLSDQESLPLSVVYKFYLEFGHMINLFDWLQAFVDKMENADVKELEGDKKRLLQYALHYI